MPKDDGECGRIAGLVLSGGKPTGTGEIAGYKVISYGAVDADGFARQLSLAPALGCDVMEEVRTRRGPLGIPSATWRYRVTSYKPGEPDRRMFQLPRGYAILQK